MVSVERKMGVARFMGLSFRAPCTSKMNRVRCVGSNHQTKRNVVFAVSSMFWQANDDPAFFDVSMGVLDSVENLSLDAHIFVDSCPPYLSVPSSAEHLTEAQVLARPRNGS